jgi:hypothetical protein
MKIKVVNAILTFDNKKNTTTLLSTENDKIILPYFEISKPSLVHQEIRYYVKSLFNNTEIKHIETIVVSALEVQNDFVIDYIKDKDIYKYDPDNELYLVSSIVLSEKFLTPLHWIPFDFSIDLSKREPLSLLIDHVLKYTLS